MKLNGWSVAKMGDVVAQTSRNARVEPNLEYRLLGVRWYGNGCHQHDSLLGSKLKTPMLSRVEPGDVTYNKMWVRKSAFAVVQEQHRGMYATSEYPTFECRRGLVLPEFLERVMVSPGFARAASDLCRGTTSRARLNPTDFLRLTFQLPPIDEQKKIAAILLSVDEAMAATQAVVAQLEVVKRATMGELLTRGLPGRHTRFKNTEIGEVPESWSVARVADCCNIRNELRKPLNQAERSRMRGPYPYYGPTKQIDSISEWRLEGEFALIGEDGDHFLKFDRWPMTQMISGRSNVNNHAHVIAGTDACSAAWFAAFFRHRDIVSRLTRQGATRYKLRKSTLEELFIALPSIDEQKHICEVLSSIEDRLAAEEATANGLRAIKSGLESVLLTGQVRVKPDPEPA